MNRGYAGFGAQFERASVEISGLQIQYMKGVYGEPLLYLHGLGGWGQWERHLFSLGVTNQVFVPQLPGWKDGKPPVQLTSVRDYAELVVAFMDKVAIKDCVVVGHSIGGWIALYLAINHPSRIKSLILSDTMGLDVPGYPVADLAKMNEGAFAAAAFAATEEIRVAGDFGDVPEAVKTGPEFERQWKGREATINLTKGKFSDPHLSHAVASIKAPTLIMWGRTDNLVPVEHGNQLAKLIPHSQYVVIENAGHMPMRHKSETFNRVVRNFLLGEPLVATIPPGFATVVKA